MRLSRIGIFPGSITIKSASLPFPKFPTLSSNPRISAPSRVEMVHLMEHTHNSRFYNLDGPVHAEMAVIPGRVEQAAG